MSLNKREAAKAAAVLDELEAYLNSAKYALFSNSQVIVDRVKMEEFLVELRGYLSEASDGSAD